VARTVVATLDLLQQGPGIPWSPAAHDLEALATAQGPRGRRGSRGRARRAPASDALCRRAARTGVRRPRRQEARAGNRWRR
jgi:hypothetical protein